MLRKNTLSHRIFKSLAATKITTTLVADDLFAVQNGLRGTPEEPSLTPSAPMLLFLSWGLFWGFLRVLLVIARFVGVK